MPNFLNPYKWLIGVALGVALLTGGYVKGRTDEKAVATAAIVKQAAVVRKKEKAQAALQQKIINAKDQQIRSVTARLADALERLRERPERLPEPARAACQGATGAELSGRDAAFLERLAARAESLRVELGACQDREHGAIVPTN